MECYRYAKKHVLGIAVSVYAAAWIMGHLFQKTAILEIRLAYTVNIVYACQSQIKEGKPGLPIWKGPWVPGLLWQRTNARLRPNGQGAEP